MGRWQTGSGMLADVPARGLIDSGRWALLSKPVTPARDMVQCFDKMAYCACISVIVIHILDE